MLVVMDIHGNEREGERIVARLRRSHPTACVAGAHGQPLHGVAAAQRQNAHGVDLNRNFPPLAGRAEGHVLPGAIRNCSP